MFNRNSFIQGFDATFVYNDKRRAGTVVEVHDTYIKLKHKDEDVTKSYSYAKMVTANPKLPD